MKNLSMMNVLPNKSIFLLLILFTINTNAHNNPIYPGIFELFFCDACGCSNNGGSLGMGGVIESNFVGIRYLHQKYESKEGIFNNSPKIDEYFNTLQIWSRIPIAQNIEVQAFVPYHFHQRNYTTKTTKINGLGDVTLLSNYTLINQNSNNYDAKTNKRSSFNHLLKIGAGIKLPTGKYNEAIDNAINPSFQLGTGSVDYLTSLQYVYKYNSFGLTNYANYYFKGSNDKDYQFGNQFNFNSTFFYVFKDEKEHSLVPSLGVSGEFYETNKQYNLRIKDTEGYAVFSSIGVEYNTEKITVGTSAMYPISQNLAQGNINVKFRSTIYINYNF